MIVVLVIIQMYLLLNQKKLGVSFLLLLMYISVLCKVVCGCAFETQRVFINYFAAKNGFIEKKFTKRRLRARIGR